MWRSVYAYLHLYQHRTNNLAAILRWDLAGRYQSGTGFDRVSVPSLTAFQLDYIQGMGFTAIWITPITEQLPQDTGYGEAYHGYWQQRMSV